jgi:hypothetical protein
MWRLVQRIRVASPEECALAVDYDFEGLSTQEIAETQEREDRKRAKRERIHTIRDLIHEETEQAEPLLGPLVRRGQTTIIGGYGQAGKSTMSLEMVRAIVTGRDFLGWEGEGASALIIDLEQGMSVAQRNIYEAFTGRPLGDHDLGDMIADMDFGDHWNRVRYADWQEGADLFTHSPDIEVLDEELAKHKPDVVLIDPIYKLFMGKDMSEQTEISAFIREIQLLRNKYGFALILPMHPRKPGQFSGRLTMHDLFGSMLWGAWAENIVMVQRDEGNLTKLHWEKDRMGQSPATKSESWTLEFERGRGYRRTLDGAAHTPKPSELIYQFLQHPERIGLGFTRANIMEALNLGRDTVDKTTERMEKRHKMDGTMWSGLHVEKHDGMPNRYSYRPTRDDQIVQEFKEQLDATEDDIPW